MAAVNFLGINPRHTNGKHQTPHRHHCMGKANITVDVKNGQVVGAFCPTCPSTDFVVLVEGKDNFWPVPSSNIIIAR